LIGDASEVRPTPVVGSFLIIFLLSIAGQGQLAGGMVPALNLVLSRFAQYTIIYAFGALCHERQYPSRRSPLGGLHRLYRRSHYAVGSARCYPLKCLSRNEMRPAHPAVIKQSTGTHWRTHYKSQRFAAAWIYRTMERILGADRPHGQLHQYRIRDSAKHYRTLVKRAELITLNIIRAGRITIHNAHIFTIPINTRQSKR